MTKVDSANQFTFLRLLLREMKNDGDNEFEEWKVLLEKTQHKLMKLKQMVNGNHRIIDVKNVKDFYPITFFWYEIVRLMSVFSILFLAR